MAAINYAEQYQRTLLQEYPYVLYFGSLFRTANNMKYRVIDAKTIQIPSISVTGRTPGNRDTIGTYTRKADNSWITLTLTNDRQWKTLIDPRDIVQTNEVMTIANITKVMNETQKWPEMDTYLVSTLYAAAVAVNGAQDTTVIAANNILSVFDGYMEEMDEARVPYAGRILYVTPPVYKTLKNAQDITRSIQIDKNTSVIDRNISRLDEVIIQTVPSDLMKSAYTFTEGWTPTAGAKQLNMILVHPDAVFTPVTYSFVGIAEPSALSDGKHLYNEQSSEDVFLLGKHSKGIQFNVEA